MRIQIFQLKFVQKMDLGLGFQKTNLRIRISILKIGLKFEKSNIEIRINIFEILCVHVRVCQFSDKTNSFDFFSPNLPKSGSKVGNSENNSRNKNQHPGCTMCANFQSKRTTLNVSA